MNSTPSFLGEITTRWPQISDPVQFVMRYAPAIRRYLAAIVKNPDDLDDVIQDFLTRVVERGFAPEQVTRGRFRDYLKASIRNAALTRLRKKSVPQATEAQIESLAAEDGESGWVDEWRSTTLEQALERLEDHERLAPEGRLHTVITLATEQPNADSATLARLVLERTGRPMTAEGFRKQLSRARVRLAELLVDEVRRTLEDPTPEQIDAELADLGLLDAVAPFRA